MAWISKGYIHTAYVDKVVECGRCGEMWVPYRACVGGSARSYTCPACNLTAAPVRLPRPSWKGYDKTVSDAWERYHGVQGRILLHPEGIAECRKCGHVWMHGPDTVQFMCGSCHTNGVPLHTDKPAPAKPYGWSEYRLTHPQGGGHIGRMTHEVLCTRCDKWVPFRIGTRLVQCPGCEMPIAVRMVGDKRIRKVHE